MSNRLLGVGLVGGGGGAFIVNAHGKAILMDGTRRIKCGALHQDPKLAIQFAEAWPYYIRGYPDYTTMIAEEAKLPLGDRMDIVVIVTPNFAHFDPAMTALEAGFPVFCEKPLCMSTVEAEELVLKVRELKIPFGVAHTYIGHWTSRLARYIVRSGLLGDVRWVDSSYIQGWLASKIEDVGQQQASWRVDPKQAGISGCGGDIATHALMELRYITGLEVARVSAHLEKFVPGRQLDDHFTAYCDLNNGGKAQVRASQVCIGFKNDLGITIAGTKGTLCWRQEESEKLTIMLPGQPDRVYWRGAVSPGDGFLPADMPQGLLVESTLPSGHPEGLHDAFARLYRGFEANVRRWHMGSATIDDGSLYATVDDGWMGLAFIESCVESSERDGAWVSMPKAL